MPGQSIAAEIERAFREVAREVGDGEFTVTLIEPGGAQANPWDPPSGANTRHDGIPGMLGKVKDQWVDGSLIRADDELLTIAGTAPKPEQDWTVEIRGTVYSIVTILPTHPSGVAINYELVLRR